MKKEIIFSAAAGFGVGALLGTLATYLITKKHAETKEEIDIQSRLTFFDEPEEEVIEIHEDDGPEVIAAKLAQAGIKGVDYSRYNQIVKEEQYKAEAEFPVDENEPEEEPKPEDPYEGFYETDEERAKRENFEIEEQRKLFAKKWGNKISAITEEDWNAGSSDFPINDYDREELWFFPITGELTDEDGTVLEPIEEYVGSLFEKFNFATSNQMEFYVRNGIKETEYYIHKEPDMMPLDFFHY